MELRRPQLSEKQEVRIRRKNPSGTKILLQKGNRSGFAKKSIDKIIMQEVFCPFNKVDSIFLIAVLFHLMLVLSVWYFDISIFNVGTFMFLTWASFNVGISMRVLLYL